MQRARQMLAPKNRNHLSEATGLEDLDIPFLDAPQLHAVYVYAPEESADASVSVWDARPSIGRVPVAMKIDGRSVKLTSYSPESRPDYWKRFSPGRGYMFIEYTERDLRIEVVSAFSRAETSDDPAERALATTLRGTNAEAEAIEYGVAALRDSGMPKLQIATAGILSELESDPPPAPPDPADELAEMVRSRLKAAGLDDVEIAVFKVEPQYVARDGSSITREQAMAYHESQEYSLIDVASIKPPGLTRDNPLAYELGTMWIGHPDKTYAVGLRLIHDCDDPGFGTNAHMLIYARTEAGARRAHGVLKQFFVTDPMGLAARALRIVFDLLKEADARREEHFDNVSLDTMTKTLNEVVRAAKAYAWERKRS